MAVIDPPHTPQVERQGAQHEDHRDHIELGRECVAPEVGERVVTKQRQEHRHHEDSHLHLISYVP